MYAFLCLAYTDRAPTAGCTVKNDEERRPERLTQRRSQDADSQDADADAAASLPTTLNKLHADAARTKKPLARPTESGRATRGRRRRQGGGILVVRLRRARGGHGFRWWFDTPNEIRVEHDGLEAYRFSTSNEQG